MTRKRKGCLWLLIGGFILLTSPWLWRSGVKWYYDRHIYETAATPARPVAIVYGAQVRGSGNLSVVLRDRMDTAIELYHSGQVSKLLVSGDNRSLDYNEPDAMRNYAIAQGVPADDVQADYAGLRTYDTCYRAKHIFGVESAVLVTQKFHLPRAIFTCRQLGVEAVGAMADKRPYRGADWYEFRETAATAVALWDVIRRNPATILGDPIPLNDS